MSERQDKAQEALDHLESLYTLVSDLNVYDGALSDLRDELEQIRDTPERTLAVLGEGGPIEIRVQWDREAEAPDDILLIINGTSPDVYDEDGNGPIPYDDSQCFAWNEMLTHLTSRYHNIMNVEVH